VGTGSWHKRTPSISRGTTLFYYEVHELEFDETEGRWASFEPDAYFTTQVVAPHVKVLQGYDVVTFSVRTSAECSPLSGNYLATEVETNQHCLLSSLEQAHQLLEDGKFKNKELGPHRIFACIWWTGRKNGLHQTAEHRRARISRFLATDRGLRRSSS